MEVDDLPLNSPLISQYQWQHYAQKQCTPTKPVQELVADHESPVHKSEQATALLQPPKSSTDQASPGTGIALYDTSAAPLNVQDSPAIEPRNPLFADLLFRGVPITPSQPRFDTSPKPSACRAVLFPVSPIPFTPGHSPNKSSDSHSGFELHAATVNAFAATVTSKLTVSTSLAHIEQVSE